MGHSDTATLHYTTLKNALVQYPTLKCSTTNSPLIKQSIDTKVVSPLFQCNVGLQVCIIIFFYTAQWDIFVCQLCFKSKQFAVYKCSVVQFDKVQCSIVQEGVVYCCVVQFNMFPVGSDMVLYLIWHSETTLVCSLCFTNGLFVILHFTVVY